MKESGLYRTILASQRQQLRITTTRMLHRMPLNYHLSQGIELITSHPSPHDFQPHTHTHTGSIPDPMSHTHTPTYVKGFSISYSPLMTPEPYHWSVKGHTGLVTVHTCRCDDEQKGKQGNCTRVGLRWPSGLRHQFSS